MKPKLQLMQWGIKMTKLVIKKQEHTGDGLNVIKEKARLARQERRLKLYLEKKHNHA